MNLLELEEKARSALPGPVYDYFAGGAGDEETLDDSVAAWSRVKLRPRVLRDVSDVTTATAVLGEAVGTPVLVAPTAFQRLCHPDGEEATARGTAAAGSLLCLSTRATSSVEQVAAAAPGAARWLQVYVLKDRSRTEDLVRRAAAAGCTALALTADTPYLGRRLRDVRNRFVLPANVNSDELAEARPDSPDTNLADQDAAVTFADVAWLRDVADLPVVVKGVTRGDDAVACLDAGAAAVWVSNHGGRQLDGCVATAEALAEVVAAVGGRAEVYVDGGVRRGVDAVRALALGAKAVFVGRPVLWGLTADGAEGVRTVLDGLTEEVRLAMALCGASRVDRLTPDLLAPAGRALRRHVP